MYTSWDTLSTDLTFVYPLFNSLCKHQDDIYYNPYPNINTLCMRLKRYITYLSVYIYISDIQCVYIYIEIWTLYVETVSLDMLHLRISVCLYSLLCMWWSNSIILALKSRCYIISMYISTILLIYNIMTISIYILYENISICACYAFQDTEFLHIIVTFR